LVATVEHLLTPSPPDVKAVPIVLVVAAAPLLGIPDDHALAATMFLGWPQHRPTRLTRRAVAEFTTVDRFDGGTFEPDAQA